MIVYEGELRLIILLAYFTGMRQNELASLRWEDVDLEASFLKTKTRKTGRGRRVRHRSVPLSREARTALQGASEATGSQTVFSHKALYFSQKFGALVKMLRSGHPGKCEDLRFHDLRRTALTNFSRSGADAFTVKAISGHQSMDMVNRYIRVGHANLRAAANRLDKRSSKSGRKL